MSIHKIKFSAWKAENKIGLQGEEGSSLFQSCSILEGQGLLQKRNTGVTHAVQRRKLKFGEVV